MYLHYRFVLSIALVITLTACGNSSNGANAARPQPPPTDVTIVVTKASDAPITFDVSGRVLAYRTAEVRARVEGILEKRLFREGGEVQEGQSLFRLDARTLQANVASADAALAKARANAEIAGQTANRYRQLIGDQAISKQELDQAESQLKQTQAEVESASAALVRARIDLDHASVRAPISGRITRAFVTEGALVGRNEATHLATIEQIDRVYVDFTQSGSQRLRMQKALLAGDLKRARTPVALILEDGSQYPQPGRLLFSEQTVDPATGTVTLRAEFPNPNRLLLPGMFATVRFAQSELGAAVKIPQRAVLASPQGQFVYVVGPENKIAAQPIETGGFSGTDWIVTNGLKGGERVVVDGLQKIRPGAVVNPIAVGTPAPNAEKPAPAAPGKQAAASTSTSTR
jgi:membrane fusion protein (multidrug efflux system)